MSVELVNAIVSTCYAILAVVGLVTYKFSLSESTEALPSLRNFHSSTNPTLTIYRYLMWRHTLLATFIKEKRYLLVQIMLSALYAAVSLRINRVALWVVAFAPVSIICGALLTEWWAVKRSQQMKQRNLENDQINSEAKKKVMTPQQIIRLVFVLLFSIIFVSVSSRIGYSVSNLGQLNILSFLLALSLDQILLRPLLFAGFIFGVKIATCRNKNILKDSSFLTFMLINEYLRSNLEQKVLPDCAAESPKRQELSPSRVPKSIGRSQLPEESTNVFLQTIKQKGLLQLISQDIRSGSDKENGDTTRRNRQEDHEQKIENICLDDKKLYDKTNRLQTIEDENSEKISKPKYSESSQDMGQGKENLAATVRREPKAIIEEGMMEDDIYLAGNFYPGRHEQTLPVTITLSPIKQRRPTKGRTKKNRVLILSGDSPYLEYLPNMLKKQESQNKIRHGSREKTQPTQNILQSRSDFANSQLKDVRR